MTEQTVKCFQQDRWNDISVFDLKDGDIFIHESHTYVAKGVPYSLNKQMHIPAEPYESGNILISFSSDFTYINMAMDYVNSPAHDFGDGTMQICDFEGGNPNIYSPRLPIAELNVFCHEHIEQYERFFEQHEKEIDSGNLVDFKMFW